MRLQKNEIYQEMDLYDGYIKIGESEVDINNKMRDWLAERICEECLSCDYHKNDKWKCHGDSKKCGLWRSEEPKNEKTNRC